MITVSPSPSHWFNSGSELSVSKDYRVVDAEIVGHNQRKVSLADIRTDDMDCTDGSYFHG